MKILKIAYTLASSYSNLSVSAKTVFLSCQSKLISMSINFLWTHCYIQLFSISPVQHSSLWMPPILQIFFVSNDMLVLLFSSLAAVTPFYPFWWRKTLELQVTKLFVPQLVFHNTKQKPILNVRDVFMSMLRYMSVSK